MGSLGLTFDGKNRSKKSRRSVACSSIEFRGLRISSMRLFVSEREWCLESTTVGSWVCTSEDHADRDFGVVSAGILEDARMMML
jgi:hypothetical protein